MNYNSLLLKSGSISIGLMLCLCGVAQDSLATKEQVALWRSNKVSIDGKDNDWPKILQFADKKAKINYAVANDESTLYLCLKTSELHTMLKILAGGLTTFINTEGKKKQSMAIMYPQRLEDFQIAPGRPDLRGLIVSSMASQHEYELEGFTSGNGKYLSTQENDSGVSLRVGINDSAELVYEASIPFKLLKTNPPKAGEASITFAIGFMIKGIAKPSPTQNSQSPDAGARRGAPTTGSLGAFPSTQNDDRRMYDLFENTKTWQLIALAQAPK